MNTAIGYSLTLPLFILRLLCSFKEYSVDRVESEGLAYFPMSSRISGTFNLILLSVAKSSLTEDNLLSPENRQSDVSTAVTVFSPLSTNVDVVVTELNKLECTGVEVLKHRPSSDPEPSAFNNRRPILLDDRLPFDELFPDRFRISSRRIIFLMLDVLLSSLMDDFSRSVNKLIVFDSNGMASLDTFSDDDDPRLEVLDVCRWDRFNIFTAHLRPISLKLFSNAFIRSSLKLRV